MGAVKIRVIDEQGVPVELAVIDILTATGRLVTHGITQSGLMLYRADVGTYTVQVSASGLKSEIQTIKVDSNANGGTWPEVTITLRKP
jgi:hypothetical protein